MPNGKITSIDVNIIPDCARRQLPHPKSSWRTGDNVRLADAGGNWRRWLLRPWRPARAAVLQARTIFGGRRHLALVPDNGQERIPWPGPIEAAFEMVLARRGTPVCLLASGDPMWFGIGASLSRFLPAREYRVYPAPSSFSLAAARLG